MGLGLKRRDLQMLAEAKLDDAQLLLQHRRFSSAYYLAGYSIEFALKACIAKQFSAESIPEKEFVNRIYSHKPKELVGLAGLASELKSIGDADPLFATNFALVAQWDPKFRYEAKDAMSAQTLMQAINDQSSGVMQWIRRYW